MYTNKVTVAASPNECYIRFSCLGPKFDEEGNVVASGDLETCQLVMSRDMLIKLRDLITEVVDNDESK